jgi:hypothetical protein
MKTLRSTKWFWALLALPLLALAAAVHISQEPRITTIAPADDLLVNVWSSSNYQTRIISSSNAALSLLSADAFLFFGDSFIEANAWTTNTSPSGAGNDWPTRLLNKSNYQNYAYTFNGGIGGSTTPQWSNWYASLIHPFAPQNGQKAMLFFQTGENDTNWMTNMWTYIMLNAQTDNFYTVAFTCPTNPAGGAFEPTHMTNNAWIRAATGLYNALVDRELQVTNWAGQMIPGVNHPTAADNDNLATWINQNIRPQYSQRYGGLAQRQFVDVDYLRARTNIDAWGLGIRGAGIGLAGAGGFVTWDGNNTILQSCYDLNQQTFAGAYFRGSTYNFDRGIMYGLSNQFGGVAVTTNLSLPTATFTLGALPAVLTNIYVTNFTVDFPSTIGISNFDQVITIPGGCSSNDLALLQVPATLQLSRTCYTCFTSNGTVYIRYSNMNTNQAVDPPVGMCNLLLFKR